MKRECSGLRGISSSCTLDLGTEVFPCLPQVPGEAATTGQRPGRWWGVGMCRSPSPRSSGQRSPDLKKGSAEFRRTACLCLSALPVTSPSRKVGSGLTEGRESGASFSPSLGASSCQWAGRRAVPRSGRGSPPSVDLTTQPSQATLATCLYNTLCSRKGSQPGDQASQPRRSWSGRPPPREDRLLIGSTEQSPPGTGRGMESPRSGTDRVGGELGAPSRGGRLGSGVLQLALGEPWEGCPRSLEGSSPRPGTGRAPRLRADAAEEGGSQAAEQDPAPAPGADRSNPAGRPRSHAHTPRPTFSRGLSRRPGPAPKPGTAGEVERWEEARAVMGTSAVMQ